MKYSANFNMSGRNIVASLLLTTMTLTACVSPRAQYIDASDKCSSIREPFIQIKEEQQKRIAAWAAAGAAIGVGTGLATGGKKNRLARVLLLGLTGMFVGAAIGYYADLEKRDKRVSAIRANVFNDAKADARTSDTLTTAVIKLNECRLREVQTIGVDYQRKAISREEAQRRLSTLRASVANDNNLIDSVVSGLKRRNGIYIDALARSGANNTDTYLSSIETYRPSIRQPNYTVGRSDGGIRVRRGANVRSGPGTSNLIVTTLSAGTSVEVIRKEGGWSYIDFGGGQGYISNSLIGIRGSSGSIQPMSIDRTARPSVGNSIDRLGRTTVELDAANEAHVASLRQSIKDTEALLLI